MHRAELKEKVIINWTEINDDEYFQAKTVMQKVT